VLFGADKKSALKKTLRLEQAHPPSRLAELISTPDLMPSLAELIEAIPIIRP